MDNLATRIRSGAVKALSIRQPWAWLILNRGKDIENRSWATAYRGPFLIHAGRTFDDAAMQSIDRETFFKVQDGGHGGIVGIATITDCVQESASPWFYGPNGFVLTDPVSPPLTRCRGMLNFFRPDQAVLDAVADQVEALARSAA